MNSPKSILVSANDPGGANAILPVVQALLARGDTIQSIVTGPALKQFRSAGFPSQYLGENLSIGIIDGALLSEDDLARAVESFKPEAYLAGTSTGNSIDKKIFKSLRECPSVYVIDFWSQYGHRFSQPESDLSHLPARICVIDSRMRDEMIAEGFPDDRLRITGNPHFEHFTEHITREAEERSRVVFVSQPIRQDAAEGMPAGTALDEFEVLERVLAVLPPHLHLSIRLHPREEVRKFDTYLNERVTIAREPTLEEALSKAGLVIGMFSPVLMQAALAGKPAISYQSAATQEDPLPTNALCITQRIGNNEELSRFLTAYENGTWRPAHTTGPFPAGATERVVEVIDELLSK